MTRTTAPGIGGRLLATVQKARHSAGVGAIIMLLFLPGTVLAQEQLEVAQLISYSAVRYGVDPTFLARIIWCESRNQPLAYNADCGCMGLAQFVWSTWDTQSRLAGWEGASPYNPEAAIDVMAYTIAHGGASHWKSCL